MTEAVGQHPTFPMVRKCPFQPPTEYADLRETKPVSQVTRADGSTPWIITRYDLVRKALADPRISSDRTLPGNPSLVPIPPAFLQPSSRPLIVQDGEEHALHRRLIINEFTVRRVQAMRPDIQRIVDDCVDRMLESQGPVDLVDLLARPVPTLVICELLGVSYEERDIFYDASNRVFAEESTPMDIGMAINDLRVFLNAKIAAKEADPGDDLLSRLVNRYRDEGIYDRERVISSALGLLIAGHETTTSMIALGFAALFDNPEQLAKLTADPSLAPKAVEELLRYLSIADMIPARSLTDEVDLDGTVLPEGTGVFALLGAANRDPEVFPEPDTLDLERPEARQHLAFGHGAHACLGANLARLELEIVYKTVFERIPGIKLAVAVDDLPFRDKTALYGISALPVTW
ncbi:cytochrome P450 [Kitasatospora brasiliensis]|uniref:cytochrome P450 n=1 Tax=Kitasatospora brasiliensis TaxID=3058040 RepID=UPI00292FD906|nr:cytochrome P450 [Kitasatospora sp. K002]